MVIKTHVLRTYLACVFLLFFKCLSGQQTEVLTGNVFDSIEKIALPYAPVILTKQDELMTTFVQTDDKGEFTFNKLSHGTYNLEVNYLGFSPKNISITIPRTTPLHIVLERNVTSLSEIVVRDTLPPITTKGDTVIYNATAFYRKEQKHLRDLVGQLPGLSVDSDNKITYLGKPVESLLVEGKPFFGGDNELALNNFPANAVGRVEVIQNYDRTGMGGIFDQKKEMALNVLLREDKKNVLFGEVTIGGAPKSYKGDINAFNYSRKSNIYTIIGANNVNEELLSFGQRFRLLTPLNASLPGEIFSRLREFDIFTPPSDISRLDVGLVTLGIERSLGVATDFNLYGAFSPAIYNQIVNNQVTALPVLQTEFRETTTTSNRSNTGTGMLRADFIKKLEKRQKITISGAVNTNLGTQKKESEYKFNNEEAIDNLDVNDFKNYSLSIRTEYAKRFAKGRANYISMIAEVGDQQDDKTLRNSEAFLDSLINWPMPSEEFHLTQNRRQQTKSFTIRNYYFYRLSNQWGFAADAQLAFANWKQLLFSTEIEQNAETLFNENRQLLTLSSNYKGRKVELRTELTGKHLILTADKRKIRSKFFMLPNINGEVTIPNAGILDFSYQRRITHVHANWYQEDPLITRFNSFQLGNRSLFPFTQSLLNLSFNRSDLLKGSTWFISFNADKTNGGSIISNVSLDRNTRVTTPVSIDKPERNIGINFFLKRDYTKANLQINIIGSIGRNWTQSNLSETLVPVSQRTYYGNLRYRYNIGKRGKVSIRQVFNSSEIRAEAQKNILYSTVTEADASLAIGSITLKGTLKAQWLNNGSSSIWQNALTASVSFRNPDTPWTFSAKGHTPIGDNILLRQSITNFFISSRTVGIFPAYVYLSVSRQF